MYDFGSEIFEEIHRKYGAQEVLSMSPLSAVFHTEVTVSIGLKNLSQSGNIHSTILDVYVVWQRA